MCLISKSESECKDMDTYLNHLVIKKLYFIYFKAPCTSLAGVPTNMNDAVAQSEVKRRWSQKYNGWEKN